MYITQSNGPAKKHPLRQSGREEMKRQT